MAKAGDFNALKARAWSLVLDAEKLVLEAEGFDQRKQALHCAKQVFEHYAVLLDKHERFEDVVQLRKRFDALQAIVAPGLKKAVQPQTC